MEGLLKKTINQFLFLFSAENVAKQYELTQQSQDDFAYESQMKYKVAEEAGKDPLKFFI